MPLLPDQNFNIPSRKSARKTARDLKKARKSAFFNRKSVELVVSERFGPKKLTTKEKKRQKRAARKLKLQTRQLTKVDNDLSEDSNDNEDALHSVLTPEERRLVEEKRQREIVKTRQKQMLELSKEDDQEIKRYEKLLGFNRRKNRKTIPNVFAAEGLDYLLDVCDSEKLKEMTVAGNNFDQLPANCSSSSDESENESLNEDKIADEVKLADNLTTDTDIFVGELKSDTISSDTMSISAKKTKIESRKRKPDIQKSKTVTFNLAENENDDIDVRRIESTDETPLEKKGEESEQCETQNGHIKEDIYGRLIDTRTGQLLIMTENASNNPMGQKLDKNQHSGQRNFRLEKSITSLVNKLSESTLHSSINQLRTLFTSNSRNDVKQILSESLFKSFAVEYRLPDRLIIEYALFLALCHSAVSAEINAYFVEHLVVKMTALTSTEKRLNDRSTENLAVLMAHLLNFKVIQNQLIIDFLRILSNNLIESNIGLILTTITYCGLTLRKGQSLLFKDLILEIQSKTAKIETQFKDDAKVRFMLETLMAIKSNNVLKLSKQFDCSILDHYQKLFKALSKDIKSKETALPVCWNDLLLAETRGRWWIVGSSWQQQKQQQNSIGKNSQEISTENSDFLDETKPKNTEKPMNSVTGNRHEQFPMEILRLANRAKMNTGVRRTVFCTIMTAKDESDSFEQLLRLNLKGHTEREIVHIALFCCMRETGYNAYYSALLAKFCAFHKRFQLTLQFAIWDRLREMHSCSKNQRQNFASLLADLIKDDIISLAVLKVVEFGSLKASVSKTLQYFLSQLFKKCTEKRLAEIFLKIINSKNLNQLADGLRIFLEMVMKKRGQQSVNLKRAENPDNNNNNNNDKISEDIIAKKRLITERVDFLENLWLTGGIH